MFIGGIIMLKADWLERAHELGLTDLTDDNSTVNSIKAAIEKAEAELEAKSEEIAPEEPEEEPEEPEDEPEEPEAPPAPRPAVVGEAQVYRATRVPALPEQAPRQSPVPPQPSRAINQTKIAKETNPGRLLSKVVLWTMDGKASGVYNHLYEKIDKNGTEYYIDGLKVIKMYSGSANVVRYLTEDKRTWVCVK